MSGINHYLLAALPALGALGSKPPLGVADFLEFISSNNQALELAKVIALSDDLVQREAFRQGEPLSLELAVLTTAEVEGEIEWLKPLEHEESGAGLAIAADEIWERYFAYGEKVARRRGSEFLARWLAFEGNLRNELVKWRGKIVQKDTKKYLVGHAGETGDEYEVLLAELNASPTPQAAAWAVERFRWRWLEQHDGWFSFGNDELAAYGARLLILRRWLRLSEAAQSNSGIAARLGMPSPADLATVVRNINSD